MYKSQNNETEIVLNYFSNRPDCKSVLSIGENDGITLSNTYDLIQKGWQGHLVEPSPTAFAKLKKLYEGTSTKIYNVGIANETGTFKFNESGGYMGGEDVALMSSLLDSEKVRWGNTTVWKEVDAEFVTFNDFLRNFDKPRFDYITIDAEGYDYEILKQIDLTALNTSCVCIEHNGNLDLLKAIVDYCKIHNLINKIGYNPENIILSK